MKHLFLATTVFALLISCSSNTDNGIEATPKDQIPVDNNSKINTVNTDKPEELVQEAKLTDGTYVFDVAFAEYQGKSMGVQVTVVVSGDAIKVTYEGQGDFSAEVGEVLDEGVIMKHKSGVWIIGTEPSDKDLDEIGGCTGGPAIIDFQNKKYWMC